MDKETKRILKIIKDTSQILAEFRKELEQFKNQQKMNENLNLIEKLKNVPAGTVFYTTTRGNCEFCRIDCENIIVKIYISGIGCTHIYELDKFGKLGGGGECIIFPSKDQRDWDKFEYDPIKVGTPCMVSECDRPFILRYYAGNGKCTVTQIKGMVKWWEGCQSKKYHITIPVSEFDFENLCRKGEAK